MKTIYHSLICLTVAGLLSGCEANSKPAPAVKKTRQLVGAGSPNRPAASDEGDAADPADRLLQLSAQQVRARLDASREQNPQARDALRAREEEISKKRMQVYQTATAPGRPEQNDERTNP